MVKCSVIIPVYNVKPYLKRCVDSVLAQTFRDFEIILVDDGSTDGCGAICDDYKKVDSRIQVIHQDNGGLSAARNTGLDAAVGEYIYFLDSDDYISPVLLDKCLESINGYDMVVFNFQNVNEDGEDIGKPIEFYVGSIRWNNEEEKTRYFEEDFFHYSYLGWTVWMRLFRREIIEQNKLRFEDNKIIYAEDMYFSYCYELQSNSIICLEDVLYYYTQRTNSIMGGQDKIAFLNLNRLNELSKAINKHLFSFDGFTVMKQRFPLAHRNIIDHAFYRIQISAGQMDVYCKRDAILANVLDMDYFNNQATGVLDNRKELIRICGLINGLRIIRDWRYYLSGNKGLYQLSRVIIRLCKGWEKARKVFFSY